MKLIIEFLTNSVLFAARGTIKGSGGRVKEQTYYYQYE